MTDTACVWFKRDLRLHDHMPLSQAVSRHKKVVLIYILEPELWQQHDMSHRQYAFMYESIVDLNHSLSQYNVSLVIKVGDAVTVLTHLLKEFDFRVLYSHQETWNGWTYERDKSVRRWAQKENIEWLEYPQHGVIRLLTNRDKWASLWYRQMSQAVCPKPSFEEIELLQPICKDDLYLPIASEIGLEDDGCLGRQHGGRKQAINYLKTFLYDRGEHYTREMSSPLAGDQACSRLSPYIAFGCLSIREVYQAAMRRKGELAELAPVHRGQWPRAISSFLSRLRWHCHFIQKLEDQPSIEFEHMHLWPVLATRVQKFAHLVRQRYRWGLMQIELQQALSKSSNRR